MIRIQYPKAQGGTCSVHRGAGRSQLSIHAGCGQAQGGTIAIMFVGLLVVIIGFCGLALDLSQVYNRSFEMHNVADMAALAAARQLDGTPGGIDRAVSAAASTIGDDGLKYQYGKQTMTWSNTAIKFSTSPDRKGQWVDEGAARGAPGGVLYVMVSTGELDPAYGEVDTIFMQVLSPTQKKASVQSDAVAGRSAINVTPLAICAMSSNPAISRDNAVGFEELVEYGFRRGVSYDLMQLNPNDTAPAVNFVVNPIAPPGTTGSSAAMDPAAVGPYVCSGTMAMPRVIGAPITVAQSFPIKDLFNQLNSRFDKYLGGLCNPSSAPPDSNVRPYVNNSNISWMGAAPNGQTAQSTMSGGKLWTVADPSSPPGGTTAPMYGPLWTYARAVPFSSYTGAAEPLGGYLPFGATNQIWEKLYSPGPTVGAYPSPSGAKTPYQANVNSKPPSAIHGLGVPNRRVLNVPLLACPGPTAPTTSATVLAIGRFFMTIPADVNSIYAEFAGAVSDEFVKGQVELYP